MFFAFVVHVVSCSGWSIPIAIILMRLQQAETNQSNLLLILKLYFFGPVLVVEEIVWLFAE